MKPYIYYTGTLPYPPCMPPHKTNISYVVFTDPESISISSETYSLLIETYIKDSSEKNQMFNAIQNFDCIKKNSKLQTLNSKLIS